MRLLCCADIPWKSRCVYAMRSVDSECIEASIFSGVSSVETTETAALGGCHQERHGWNGRAVYGWPEVVCLRMAGGRLLADGPRSSADGDSPSRMVNVVKWVRSGSALAGWQTPWSAARPRSGSSSFSFELPTTLAITRISTKKKMCAGGDGRWVRARARTHC